METGPSSFSEFPWKTGVSVGEKRKAEGGSKEQPVAKKVKVGTLQQVLQNQKDFQMLMAKQQHAFQQQLMDMLGKGAINE